MCYVYVVHHVSTTQCIREYIYREKIKGKIKTSSMQLMTQSDPTNYLNTNLSYY